MTLDAPIVTAIGTCRVHNPLSYLDRGGRIRLNHNPMNQFVHSTGEILQRIGVLKGGRGVPDEIADFVFDEGKKVDKPRFQFEETEFFVVEVSSLKFIKFLDHHLQYNRIVEIAKRELGGGFEDWMSALRRDMKDGRGSLIEGAEFSSCSELVKMSEVGMLDELGLERDLRKILSHLGGGVIFVNHIGIGKIDGKRLFSRDALCRMMRNALERCEAISFDPTNIVIENGREKMLLKSGEDINHYSDFGEEVIGTKLLELIEGTNN